MELGLSTFADIGLEPGTGGTVTGAERMRNLMEEIELADQVGLDVSASASTTAPTSSLLAGGRPGGGRRAHRAHPPDQRGHRAQPRRPGARVRGVRHGRPAVGRPRRDHGRARLVHRVVPALRLRPRRLRRAVRRAARAAAEDPRGEHVDLGGRAPPAARGLGVYPRPVQDPLPVWIASAGTPQSVARAGLLGLPVGARDHRREPERFAPLAELLPRGGPPQAGHDASCRSGSTRTPTSPRLRACAADDFFPPTPR